MTVISAQRHLETLNDVAGLLKERWRPPPARPQHPSASLPLLPSGPDGVHKENGVGRPARTTIGHYPRAGRDWQPKCDLSVRCPRIRHSPNVRQTRWHRASGTARRFGLAGTIGKVDQARSVELAAMTICPGGDRCVRGVQIGRGITRDADGSGGSSAPRPARPAQQHPMQPAENSEKAKPAFSTDQPAGSGVADWPAKGRGGGQQVVSCQKEPLSKSTIRL